MGPVNENLELLVKKITDSNMDREQVIMFMGDIIGTLIANNVPLDQRWGVSMTLSAKYQKLNETRVASGFFGNWAKHHEEQDQDVGC